MLGVTRGGGHKCTRNLRGPILVATGAPIIGLISKQVGKGEWLCAGRGKGGIALQHWALCVLVAIGAPIVGWFGKQVDKGESTARSATLCSA